MTLPNDQPPVHDAGVAVLHRVEDAARRLSTSRASLWAHIAAGNIASVQLGRSRRIPASEVDRISREGLPSIPRGRYRRRQAT